MLLGSSFDPLPSRIPLVLANALNLIKPRDSIPYVSRIMNRLFLFLGKSKICIRDMLA